MLNYMNWHEPFIIVLFKCLYNIFCFVFEASKSGIQIQKMIITTAYRTGTELELANWLSHTSDIQHQYILINQF
jgi:hypothetical protein